MTDELRYRRNEDLPYQEIDGELVVVNAREWSHHLVEGAGLLVWEKLEQPHTAAELIEAICEEYDVEPSQAEADLQPFLSLMLERGLILPVS